jgi:hypothetical protein
VSTLADLVRARTRLDDDDVDWLHRLVGEWQLVADLSFADLVLRVRTHDGSWLTVAHMRPTTGPTTWPEDLVGSEVPPAAARRFERAADSRRILRQAAPEWHVAGPVRAEIVPVRRGSKTSRC